MTAARHDPNAPRWRRHDTILAALDLDAALDHAHDRHDQALALAIDAGAPDPHALADLAWQHVMTGWLDRFDALETQIIAHQRRGREAA